MKNRILKTQNFSSRPINRLDRAKERISELKNRPKEYIQIYVKEKKMGNKTVESKIKT